MKKLLISLFSALFISMPAIGMQEAAQPNIELINIEPVKALLAKLDYLHEAERQKCIAAVDTLLNPVQIQENDNNDNGGLTLAQEQAKAMLLDHLLQFVDHQFVTDHIKRSNSGESTIEKINEIKVSLRHALETLTSQQLVFCYYVMHNTVDTEEKVLTLFSLNSSLITETPAIYSLLNESLRKNYAAILRKRDTLSDMAAHANALHIIKSRDANKASESFKEIQCKNNAELTEKYIFELLKAYVYSSPQSTLFLDKFIENITSSLSPAEKTRCIQRLTTSHIVAEKYSDDSWLKTIRKECLSNVQSKWDALQTCWGLFSCKKLRFTQSAKNAMKALRETTINDLKEMEITSNKALANALDIDIHAIAKSLELSPKDIEKLSMQKFAFIDLAINGSLYSYGLTIDEIEKVWDNLDNDQCIKDEFMQWIRNNINQCPQKRAQDITALFKSLTHSLVSFADEYKQSTPFNRALLKKCLHGQKDLPFSITPDLKQLLDDIMEASSKLKKSRANIVSVLEKAVTLDKDTLARKLRMLPKNFENITTEQFIILETIMNNKESWSKQDITDIFDCFNMSHLIENATTRYDFNKSALDSVMPFIVGGSLAYIAYKMPKGFLKSFKR